MPHWQLPDPRDIQILGHRIRYWDAGQGDPLVLVHGFSGSAVYERDFQLDAGQLEGRR